MIKPTTIGGLIFGVEPYVDAPLYTARDASGILAQCMIGRSLGGYYEIGADAEYIVILADAEQGKHGGDELVAAAFKRSAGRFVDYLSAGLPEGKLFHAVSGPANPNFVWIKNGGQANPAVYPRDPGGTIGRYRVVTTRRLRWETMQVNTVGLTISYQLWERSFDPATGIVGPLGDPIDQRAVDPAKPPVDPPQEWF